MPVGGSKPGERRGGRAIGTPNKVPASIREMIVGALSDVGGRRYLAEQARENPVAFMGLVGKVLPLQLTGQNGGPVAIDCRWAEPEPADKPALTIEAELEDEAVVVTFSEPAP